MRLAKVFQMRNDQNLPDFHHWRLMGTSAWAVAIQPHHETQPWRCHRLLRSAAHSRLWAPWRQSHAVFFSVFLVPCTQDLTHSRCSVTIAWTNTLPNEVFSLFFQKCISFLQNGFYLFVVCFWPGKREEKVWKTNTSPPPVPPPPRKEGQVDRNLSLFSSPLPLGEITMPLNFCTKSPRRNWN